MDFFNTCSNVLATIHVDCTLVGCSSSHEVACIRGKKSLTGVLQLPTSSASKASLVTSSRCEQCLNGAPKGRLLPMRKDTWNSVGIAPEMALVAAPKMALPMALQAVPERGWYGAWNGVGCSPKNALPMALQAVPKRGWYGAWNGAGCSPKNALPMALQVVPERGLLNACNGVFYEWMMPTIYGSPAAIV